MQAWILEKPSSALHDPLRPVERPDPQPGPGEVRLRVRACGVCHTDLHTVEGELELPRLPVTPGHQVVGVVDAVGPGVDGVRLGERRGAYWLRQACGSCPACRRGEENLCPEARFNGLHADGGYAQAMIVPAAYTVPIPSRYADEEAAPLLCAGIIGYRALRLSGIRPGGRLALFGFGASAHLVIQLARARGCRVEVYTRSEGNRSLARSLGAWRAVGAEVLEDPTSSPPENDAAILFAPAGGLVPLALRAVRPGGTVTVNAIHMSDIPSFPYRLLHGERILRSVAHVTRRDALDFSAEAAETPLRVHVRPYPFQQANDALRDLKRGRIHGAAVLRSPAHG